MTKVVFHKRAKSKKDNKYSLENIKEALGENHACYVLITCTPPTKEGKMHVDMSYEGDHCLASYLIDSAQSIIEEQRPIKDAEIRQFKLP